MKNIIIILLVIMLAFAGIFIVFCSPKHITPLIVYGDISNIFYVDTLLDNKAMKQKIDYKDYSLDAISLGDIISWLDLVYQKNDIYFISYDGYMNKMDLEQTMDAYLGYNSEVGWIFVSESHPLSSAIKQIESIVIVKDEDAIDYKYGLNIVDAKNGTNNHFSIGQLYTRVSILYPYHEASAEKIYSVDVISQKRLIFIEDLVNEEFDNITVMTKKGEISKVDKGYIEITKNTLNYVLPLQSKIIRDISGIIINSPKTSNMHTFDDVLDGLNNGQDVMVILIDGFSYGQYIALQDIGEYYLIEKMYGVQSSTVYMPVTNAGLATILTGKDPLINGVLNRDFRQLNAADMFSVVNDMGRESLYIEGDINILATSIMAELNIDKNSNGSKDDEIFDMAYKNLESGYNLIFVHFHSLDEYGHEYGPLAKETLEQFLVIDEYCKKLINKFSGTTIVVSDHGMHQIGIEGDHGEFRYEDMIVPYIVNN